MRFSLRSVSLVGLLLLLAVPTGAKRIIDDVTTYGGIPSGAFLEIFGVAALLVATVLPLLVAGILALRDQDRWKLYLREAVVAAGIYPAVLAVSLPIMTALSPEAVLSGIGVAYGLIPALIAAGLIYMRPVDITRTALILIHLGVFLVAGMVLLSQFAPTLASGIIGGIVEVVSAVATLLLAESHTSSKQLYTRNFYCEHGWSQERP